MRKEILKKLESYIEVQIKRNVLKLSDLKSYNEKRNRENTISELKFFLALAVEGQKKNDTEYVQFLDIEKVNRAKISLGNKKTGVASWNILEGVTCTFATKQCLRDCYAKQSSMMYKKTMFMRIFNTLVSLRNDFKTLLNVAIKKSDVSVLRLHDSGGFIGEQYLMDIVGVIKQNPYIEFITYTKNLDYSIILNKCTNCVSNFSIFEDSKEFDIYRANMLEEKTFECMTFDRFIKEKNNKCPIYAQVEVNKHINKQRVSVQCKDCKKCMTKSIKKVIVLKH